MTEWLSEALSLLALGSALGLLVARHAVVGALCLLACLLAVAGLCVVLAAEYVAVALILFGGSAVLVLALFLFMLLGVGDFWPERLGRRFMKIVAVATAAALGALLLEALPVSGPPPADAPRGFSGAEAMGEALVGVGLLPLIGTSLALLAALLGVLVLARVRA